MARIRTIKPEFPQSESMGRVSRDARLCFIMLWTIADDSGRLRGNSRMLASLLFPYDDDAKKHIDTWLGELETEGCAIRYTVGGDSYIQITGWTSHQKIDKPSVSKLPAPPADSESPREDSPKVREVSSGDLRTKDQGPKDQGGDSAEAPPLKKKKPEALECPDDVEPQVWADWLALRKRKSAPVTATVISGSRDEAKKAELSFNDFLKVWCRRGSQGLEAEWLKKGERFPAPTQARDDAEETKRMLAKQEAGRAPIPESLRAQIDSITKHVRVA